jgi:putative ABC transport system ATP-binding protein
MSGLYTRDEAETKARLLLDLVGVGDRANNKPSQLSGGQQQRVAVARAISMNPSFVIMDEPTGAIDAASAAQLLSLIKAMNALGKTFIIATHNPEVARIGGRIATLRSGRLLEGGAVEHPMEEVDVRRIASTYRRCLDIDLLALKRRSDASEVDRIEEEINSVSSFLGDN